MHNRLFQFDTVAVKNVAAVMDLRGVPDSEYMRVGKSFKNRFPSTAAFRELPQPTRHRPRCLRFRADKDVRPERLLHVQPRQARVQSDLEYGDVLHP